jgi:AraC family transcriptional regulator
MKKISTKKTHHEQINLALAYINSNYAYDIPVEELAGISGYSLYHFHRIFKSISGENVHNYIKNTRLEKASNLLIYNQHKKIEEIALWCGFSTGTGFSMAFKKRFSITPRDWRKVGFELYNTNIQCSYEFNIKEPIIVNMPILPILYIRTYGYKSDMSSLWQQLYEWCEPKDVFSHPHKFLGVFHTHPYKLPYNNARYLASINSNTDIYRSGEVGRCKIYEGRFAKFHFICTHEELYKYMQYCYINWLHSSRYELRNFPSYVEYKNPKQLLQNGILEVDFYMPIQNKV